MFEMYTFIDSRCLDTKQILLSSHRTNILSLVGIEPATFRFTIRSTNHNTSRQYYCTIAAPSNHNRVCQRCSLYICVSRIGLYSQPPKELLKLTLFVDAASNIFHTYEAIDEDENRSIILQHNVRIFTIIH